MLIAHLAWTVVAPIAAMIAVGYVLDRRFRLDIATLARLNFWVFVPVLVFVKLVQATFPGGELTRLAGVAALQVLILALAGGLVALLIPRLRSQWRLLSVGSASYNIGNYGIPFVTFAFGEAWLGVAIAVLLVQNVAIFTAGPALLGGAATLRSALLGLLRIPVLYAVALALMLRSVEAGLPGPLMQALVLLAGGLVPMALVTLGAQIARTPIFGPGSASAAALTLLRLVVGPALTWVLCTVLGIDGELRRMLTVCAGLPMAVNVFIICSEYGRDSEAAARAIVWTTVLATLFLPVLLVIV